MTLQDQAGAGPGAAGAGAGGGGRRLRRWSPTRLGERGLADPGRQLPQRAGGAADEGGAGAPGQPRCMFWPAGRRTRGGDRRHRAELRGELRSRRATSPSPASARPPRGCAPRWTRVPAALRAYRRLRRPAGARASLLRASSRPAFRRVKAAADEILALNQDAMVRKSERAERRAEQFQALLIGRGAGGGAAGAAGLDLADHAAAAPGGRRRRRRCGASARATCKARARVRGGTRSPSWPPSSTPWPTASSATGPARWASCCRRSRRRRRPSTGCPIRWCCWTPAASCLGVNQPPPAACWRSTPRRRRRSLRGRRSRRAGGARSLPGARRSAARAPTCRAGFEEAIRLRRRRRASASSCRGRRPSTARPGEVAGVAVVFQDITRLFRFDELKNNLVATVAHEFRTPLTSLRMAIHLCLEQAVGPLTAKQADLLYAARDDCERLQTIVDDLLNLSRIESGRIDLHKRRVDARVAGRRRPSTCTAPPPRIASVTRALRGAAGLPEVFADPDRLQLVFTNLISNAIRYSPAGGEIVVSARPELRPSRSSAATPAGEPGLDPLRGARPGPGHSAGASGPACSRSSSACPAAPRAARAWACSSPGASSRPTAARSASTASPARARPSGSPSAPPRN